MSRRRGEVIILERILVHESAIRFSKPEQYTANEDYNKVVALAYWEMFAGAVGELRWSGAGTWTRKLLECELKTLYCAMSVGVC